MIEERSLQVEVDGNELSAGVAIRAGARAAVLLLHGIPSVSPPAPDDRGYPGLAVEFADRGYLAGWVDMRGVRESPGYFSIEGWVRDATAAFDAVRALDPSLPAVLVGSSAGGAVAATALSRGTEAEALALLAAPADWVSFSADAVAGVQRVKLLAGMEVGPEVESDPTQWAAEFEQVRTRDAVARIDAPILIVHGSADDVVPVSHADDIAANARHAEVSILEGGAHQLRRDPAALEVVFAWLDRVI